MAVHLPHSILNWDMVASTMQFEARRFVQRVTGPQGTKFKPVATIRGELAELNGGAMQMS